MKKRGENIRQRLLESVLRARAITKNLPLEYIFDYLGRQLIRSTCSSYLYYGEADSSASAKDFVSKLRIVLKEINESEHNLELLAKCEPGSASNDIYYTSKGNFGIRKNNFCQYPDSHE